LLGSFFLFGKQKSEAKWCFTFLSLHHWDKKGGCNESVIFRNH